MFWEPMLLEKQEQPFDDDRYVFEPKIDGHRNLLSMAAGQVRLYTRHNNDVTTKYPELHDIPIDDNSDILLDGEVACQDPVTGSIDFDLIQQRSLMRKPMTIRQAMVSLPVHYYVFDILWYRGRDLRSLPLVERKKILSEVVRPSPYFSPVLSVPETGKALFDVIKDKKLEGIVAKRKRSRYVGRRSLSWIKIINYQYETVDIVGYRKNQFGWLVRHEGRIVGIIELAVPAAHRQAFFNISKTIIKGEDRDYIYLSPSIQAKVRFRNWTRTGMLRAPEFVDFVV